MNRKEIKNITELKDSYILYKKELPRFGYIIIVLVVLLLVAFVVWSIKTPKTYIVKSQGVVESQSKNYIMTPYTGIIKQMNVSEGSFVKEGDVLFSVKSTDLDLQFEQIVGQINVFENNINQLKKLEQSIMDKTNYFEEESDEDRQYYNQYKTYISQIEQNKFDPDIYSNYGYTDEQIAKEKEKNKAKESEIYYSTLEGINENINQYENEINKLKIQNEAISKGQAEYNILANTSGAVHLLSDYKTGMVIQATNVLGSISNDNEHCVISLCLSANDRPRVSIGDDVNIEVLGLSQSVYGNLSGKIQMIDNDLTTSSDGKQTFFKAKATMDKSYLESKDGKKVNVLNGMSVETRITYDKITYFDYFLDLLV